VSHFDIAKLIKTLKASCYFFPKKKRLRLVDASKRGQSKLILKKEKTTPKKNVWVWREK
jgi:hypothetical protein